jgi:hypothetical protein
MNSKIAKFTAFTSAVSSTTVVGDDPYKPYPWTIHVTPHSHDDVGWLKTLNAYFDGSDKDTQNTNVNIELTTIIDALSANPERKFSECEIAFFKKWWDM